MYGNMFERGLALTVRRFYNACKRLGSMSMGEKFFFSLALLSCLPLGGLIHFDTL